MSSTHAKEFNCREWASENERKEQNRTKREKQKKKWDTGRHAWFITRGLFSCIHYVGVGRGAHKCFENIARWRRSWRAHANESTNHRMCSGLRSALVCTAWTEMTFHTRDNNRCLPLFSASSGRIFYTLLISLPKRPRVCIDSNVTHKTPTTGRPHYRSVQIDCQLCWSARTSYHFSLISRTRIHAQTRARRRKIAASACACTFAKSQKKNNMQRNSRFHLIYSSTHK